MEPTNAYLAIGAIFQNEAPYLAEWICFHQLMGVQHFYLYNNSSTDDYKAVLSPWLTDGSVTLIDWPQPFTAGVQRQAYEDCLGRARGHVRWLAFIDIDEFLFSPAAGVLPAALEAYEPFPGVVVHWQVFGSCSTSENQSDLVIERFIHRARRNWVRNRRVKSIVDPMRTVGLLSVHHCHYLHGAKAVNECGTEIHVQSRPQKLRRLLRQFAWLLGPWMHHIDPYKGHFHVTHICPCQRLRIHHYILKSPSEYRHKAERRKRLWALNKESIYDDFFRYHDQNEVTDPVLLGIAAAVRERLATIQGDDARPSK